MAFKILSNSSSANLDVSIEINAPISTTAPASYIFTASHPERVLWEPQSGAYASYTDLDFIRAEYFWDFSQIETEIWTGVENYVSERNVRKNNGVGRTTMKCFETPGTHTVGVLVVFPDGRWGTATTAVTIGDPDVDWTTAQTVVYSSANNFTGAPAHAYQVTDWVSLKNLFASFPEPKMRVLFPREVDQTVDFSSWVDSFKFENSTNPACSEVYFGSWVRGEKALLDFPNGSGALFSTQVPDATMKFEDLYFRSTYDQAAEIGNHIGKVIAEESRSQIVFNNCKDRSVNVFAQLSGTAGAEPGRIHFNNHYRTHTANFLALWSRLVGWFAVTGSTSICAPDTANGQRGKLNIPSARNEHNFCRAAGNLVYFYGNDVFAKQSWSGGQSLSINPPGRIGRSNPPDIELVVACNVFEGLITYQLDDNVGNYNNRKGVFERNLFILHSVDPRGIDLINGQVSVRNNIFLKHDTFPNWRAGVHIRTYRTPPEGLNEPIFVYNNTFRDLSDDTNGANFEGVVRHTAGAAGFFNHVEEANNLIVRENLSSPVNAGVIDTTPLGWSSRMDAVRLNWVGLIDTIPSTVAPGGSFEIPYSKLKSYAPSEGGGGVQLGQADFSGVNQNPPTYDKFAVVTYLTDASDVSIAMDTPSVGKVRVTNNSGSSWGAGSDVRLYFAPIPATEPRIIWDDENETGNGILATVPNGGTLVFENPEGFTLDGVENYVKVSRNYGSEVDFVPTATGLVVQNNTVDAGWAAGSEYDTQIDTGDNPPPRMPEFAHPSGTISMCRPLAPVNAPDALKSVFDFEGVPRTGSNHPDAPAGTYTAGAIEP